MPIILLLLALISVLPKYAIALPIHTHCDQKEWGPLTSSSTTPSLPADYRKGGDYESLNAFGFQVLLNDPPPPSANPDCDYEISDITQIDIMFTFVGTMTWGEINFGAGMAIIDPVDPINFVSGVSRSFQFEPHLGTDPKIPGPLEIKMPFGKFPVTLKDDNNDFNITAASINVKGHHYYIETQAPEPSILALLGFGGFAVFLRHKKNPRRPRLNA